MAERIECDRCPARAAVEVTLATGGLAFCQHHYDEYAPGLKALGAIVHTLEVTV